VWPSNPQEGQLSWVIAPATEMASCCQFRSGRRGIIAKRMNDPYAQHTKWFKILNREYSQKIDRAELFKKK
jgi:hypothetical protein